MQVDIPFFFIIFLLGAVMGSFGNVVILRGIQGKSVRGRSQCPYCGKILGPLELIPVVSFFIQGGKCAECKHSLSWQYPLVEMASAILFTLTFYILPYAQAGPMSIALWLLLLLCVTDARTGYVPDALSIPFLLASLLYAVFLPVYPWAPIAIGVGFFGLQWVVSKGTWIGTGDIIIAAGMGALAGDTENMILALFAAYIIGAAFAIVLLIRKKKHMQSQLPFGPFLGIGTLVAVFLGNSILQVLFPV
jgi:prepilin signal peptidase PulO-like enzyme (type II secretory pathway)